MHIITTPIFSLSFVFISTEIIDPIIVIHQSGVALFVEIECSFIILNDQTGCHPLGSPLSVAGPAPLPLPLNQNWTSLTTNA